LDPGWNHWDENEIVSLLNIETKDAIEEVKSKIQQEINEKPGVWYQKMFLLELRTRQRFFTNYQAILSDYWYGVATPFINRTYANFCLSLPRLALDKRRLLTEVYKRYFFKLSTIPGTYGREPLIRTGRYLLSKRMASIPPAGVSNTIFPGFQRNRQNMDVICVQKTGKPAFKPLFDNPDLIGEWMNRDLIEKTYRTIFTESNRMAVRKLQSIQTFAYRLSTGHIS